MSIESLTFLVGLMIVGYGCVMWIASRIITGLIDDMNQLKEQVKTLQNTIMNRENPMITLSNGKSIPFREWLDSDEYDLSQEELWVMISGGKNDN